MMESAPMSSPSPTPVMPPPRKRRRWWRVVLGFAFLLIAGPAIWWIIGAWKTHTDWDAAVKEAADDTPRWTLAELEADRKQIADADNSALFMISMMRNGNMPSVSMAAHYEKIFDKLPPPVELNRQQVELTRATFANAGDRLEMARRLKDKPWGRFPIQYSDDFISTLVADHQNVRQFGELLRHDAYLLAHDKKYDQAVASCHALLNSGRALADELFLISLFIRVAMHQATIDALERTLAQGEAGEAALRTMQAALEQEAHDSGWLQAVRGERAGHHHLFENVKSGKVNLSRMGGVPSKGARSPGEWFVDTFPSVMIKYYPDHLHYMNRAVEVAKLPIHERNAKFQEMEAELVKSNNVLNRLLAPAYAKVHQAESRSQAMLRSAAAALACERYR
jgi:hypothetical protein